MDLSHTLLIQRLRRGALPRRLTRAPEQGSRRRRFAGVGRGATPMTGMLRRAAEGNEAAMAISPVVTMATEAPRWSQATAAEELRGGGHGERRSGSQRAPTSGGEEPRVRGGHNDEVSGGGDGAEGSGHGGGRKSTAARTEEGAAVAERSREGAERMRYAPVVPMRSTERRETGGRGKIEELDLGTAMASAAANEALERK